MADYFDLFVTSVDRIGPMLKIWGQVDRLNSMMVEQLLKSSLIHFQSDQNVPNVSELSVGLKLCAKYKDGHYYRAEITNLRQLVFGSVEVKFIDYGNVEIIALENLRLLEDVPTGLNLLSPQATDFILANVFHINQQWDDKALSFIHSEIAYMELKSTIVGAVNEHKFIKVMFHDIDLSEYLIQRGIAVPVSLALQENMIKNPNLYQIPSPITNIPVPLACSAPRSSNHQLQHEQPLISSIISTPELCSFKTHPLKEKSEHMVYISYVEDGPYLFSVQLQSMEDALEKLMIEINQLNNLLPLTESPVPGYPCLSRCLEDNSLCRAVVINLVEDKCKTYYVDFGNTDILPFSHIFQIPFKYVLPKVMSMRFTLAGLKNVKVTNEMKCAFKEYVTNRLLKLKVLKLEGSVLQYCELYDEENRNVINVLYDQANNYKNLSINKGLKYNVIVSYIKGCKKFFVQLKECSNSLNNLMLALANNCDSSPPLQTLDVGMPCVAFYSGDNQWYRAEILSIVNDTVTVKYVDYGNEEIVSTSCLKKIDPNFVKILPAQAIECCLYGYQNMSFNNEIESVFDSLTLECEFTMKVISKQNNDSTLLVDLFDADGNNVAALLIEKLASQKSQISPLPANKITKSLLSNKENIDLSTENQYVEIKSPKSNVDTLSWRSSGNDKPWKNDKSYFRTNSEEKIIRRNTENSPPKFRNSRVNNHSMYNKKRNRVQNESWNGNSPTNKRSQRNERSFSRSSNNSRQGRGTGKFSKRSPRNNDSGKGNSWNNSGSESEKSWSGNSISSRSGRNTGYKKDFKQKRNDFPKKSISKTNDNFKSKVPFDLPVQNLASLTDLFNYVDITLGTSECVGISWFYNPENFFCQLSKNEKDFRDMMNDIQSSYNGRPPVNSDIEIPVGASIITEFHEDSILYRATVLENKFPKFKVQYVDFGNVSLVDISKIWQVETKFMILPMQAFKCGLVNIKSAEENWPETTVIDNIFNRECFTCKFIGCNEEQYFIELFDNDIDVRQKLIESEIAVDPTVMFQMVDEPVDLNMLIGQHILISISFIEGLNKFFIHLQNEKAITVQNAIETYMKSVDLKSLKQLTEDQIIPGATCIVQVNNEKWNRAVITNNSDMNSIQVDYPDFGGSGTYSTTNIYALPQQLCVYWYQAFECSLFNLTDENKLVNDEDFKVTYEGKELIIYIEEIVNSRFSVTLYDKSGEKLKLIDYVNEKASVVNPLCPMPILNNSFSVYVTHVNNVSSLYLQRDSDNIAITSLLENLYNFYENKNEVVTLNKGDLCCAKSEDGNWYRGRVMEYTDEIVKVLYIDYGNVESISKINLRNLDRSFYNHELAIHVSLNLIEVSPELTNKITELTTDKLFTANISFGETGWIVDLLSEELNLNQTLIDLNLATFATNSTEATQETIVEETEFEGITTEVVVDDIRPQVTITHVDSPSEFYVQLVANEQSIYTLQADLQEKIKDLPDLDGADIGVLCAAKYTVDELWYRAEVLDADAEITTVRFVDYGNTDVITNNQGSIKMLPAELLAVDKYARKCSLNLMPNKGEEWSQEASEIFENAISAEIIYADIVYQDEKNKTYIDLFINGNNIAEQLLNANLAVPITRDVEDNIANNTGFVSHVNSLSEFWIQLESSVLDLEMIVDRLANADTFADLQDLSPGILCAANFPDDEMWYRARILSNTVAGIEVLFVDYGNSSTAMKLKVLPEDLIQMPILAQKCSLNKPPGIALWSEQATEKFREISEEGATIFTVKKLAAGETSVVELFIEKNNIVDQLIDLCEQNVVLERMTPIGEPNYTKVFITHIETPSYFWIQLTSDSEKIDDMTETLVGAGSFKKLVDWNIDTVCAALYMDSGLWYRGKIIEFVDEYEVLLVDYGNTIYTNDLRVLPQDLASIPPLATLCTLQLPKDVLDWNEMAYTKFMNLTDNSKECRIDFIDNEVPSTVRLFVDGKNVAEEICFDAPQAPLTSISAVSLISDEISLLAVNTQLPEPVADGDDIDEISQIEQTEDEINETFLTAKEGSNESSDFNNSNETVKESSFAVTEPVHVTLTNQSNSLTNEISTTEMLYECQAEGIFADTEFHDHTKQNDSIISGVDTIVKIEDKIENISQDLELNINNEITTITSRPTTPHCDKIVPGSICRGDLEESERNIIEVTGVVQEPLIVENRPVTPQIVKNVLHSTCKETIAQIPLNYVNDDNIYEVSVSEKIMPDSICKEDLGEPSLNSDKKENAKCETIPESVIIEEPCLKTVIEEKIVPGSINKGE